MLSNFLDQRLQIDLVQPTGLDKLGLLLRQSAEIESAHCQPATISK